MNPSSEIGRELRAGELVEGTVVWLSKTDDQYVSVWVRHVDLVVAIFHGARVGMMLGLFRSGDTLDELVDATGAVVRVFEYLGVI